MPKNRNTAMGPRVLFDCTGALTFEVEKTGIVATMMQKFRMQRLKQPKTKFLPGRFHFELGRKLVGNI